MRNFMMLLQSPLSYVHECYVTVATLVLFQKYTSLSHHFEEDKEITGIL